MNTIIMKKQENMTKQEFMAMSLPYGLKCKELGLNEIFTLNPKLYSLIELLNWSNVYQPLLRPLSDLTKEIEHKGEKFVPIARFLEDIVREWNMCNINYPNDAKGLYGDIIKNITSCEFWIIQKLIEWHFDIADLISKGEAIDVNTLDTNPYK